MNYQVAFKNIADLAPYERNSKTHSPEQVSEIAASMQEFGFTNPVLADDQGIVAGHGRVMGAQLLYDVGKTIYLPGGEPLPAGTVPVIDCTGWTEAQRRAYIIADNRLAEKADWDMGILEEEIRALDDMDFDVSLTGFDLDDFGGQDEKGDGEPGEPTIGLADRFVIPPFSVLNAREGWWQDRKRHWLSLGIRSEEGRQNTDDGGGTTYARKMTRKPTTDPVSAKIMEAGNGTSIFDPVLCELAYRWFSPIDGVVLDPFAGGSVRGVVAARLQRRYVGCELREEQVDANVQQAAEINASDAHTPTWRLGDSIALDDLAGDVDADFIFSCPPYAHLEAYSKLPGDLSNMKLDAFLDAYRTIIAKACDRLKPDRFACFVVGEVRDKKTGAYCNFVGETVEAFRAAGLQFYNEAILVTALGSLAVRTGQQFEQSRKLGKAHQNVLVFVKGDPRKAAAACGDPTVPGDIFDGAAGTIVTCPNCDSRFPLETA